MKPWVKIAPYWNRVNDIIFADVSNFILKSDGVGLFLQNFKTLEPLKIKKVTHQS